MSENRQILDYIKSKKFIIVSICAFLIFIIIVCVIVPNVQKQRQKEQLEATYTERIEESIESFKQSHIQAIKNQYGAKYSNISFDIRYVLSVFDSGNIRLTYYIEGDEILEDYSSFLQKKMCNGFYGLFSNIGTRNIHGEVYINDSQHVSFNDLYEEAQTAQENENTCKVYFCYEKLTRASGYCAEHDYPGWRMD